MCFAIASARKRAGPSKLLQCLPRSIEWMEMIQSGLSELIACWITRDSGSLLVEDVSANPRAAGLLYAGSGTAAIANPMAEVLQYVGGMLGGVATMVGN